MRTIKLIFAAIIMIALYSCGGKGNGKISFSDPAEYNDFIVDIQKDIINEDNIINDAIDAGDIAGAKTKLSALEIKCKSAIDTLNKLDEYKGNTGFRDAAVNLFTLYHDHCTKEFKEELDLLAKPNRTDQDMDKANKISSEFNKKINDLNDKFIEAQKKFADENNLQLM